MRIYGRRFHSEKYIKSMSFYIWKIIVFAIETTDKKVQTVLKCIEINLSHLVGTVIANMGGLPNSRHYAKYFTYIILFTPQLSCEILLLSSPWPSGETEAHPMTDRPATSIHEV